MTKKKGYQLLDVPNNKRGRRFFEDFQEFLNKDWYGYHRRGRLPKPGVPLNWQGQSRVLDSSRWAIYVRGVPAPRKFIEHSKLQRARTGYKYYRDLYDKTCIWNKTHNDELMDKIDGWKKEYDKKVDESKQAKVKLNKYKLRLFRWNISLWKEERREGNI